MKARYKVLFLLVLLSVITYLDRVCMNVVAKYVKADLGLNNEQFGYILGAFSLAYAFFEIPTGALGDRKGPRKVLTRVVVWWSMFTMLTGSVSSFILMIIVRFLFGIGEAGAYPNASIAIAKWFPKAELARAQSAIWAAGRLGGALTPLIVIPLVHALGWRSAFFILGFVGIAWALLWYFWFRDEPKEKLDSSSKELNEIESLRTVKPGVHHISWKVIGKNKNIWALMLMCHLFFYAAYFFTNWSSTYFQEGRGMSEDEAKNFVSLSYFLGAVGCLTGGFLSDWLSGKFGLKIGRRLVAIIGLGSSSLFFFLAGSTADSTAAGYFLAVCVLTKDLALPVAFTVCVDIGRRHSGTVVGAMNFAGQLGGFFVTIIFGMIVQQFGNFNYPLYLISALLIISASLWFFIDPTKPVEVEEG
jgi:MFS transporter, ACS family, glucarate transporter